MSNHSKAGLKTKRDFSLEIYKELLQLLISKEYSCFPVIEYLKAPGNKEKTIILRHDVDRMENQAVIMGELEHRMGIRSTYYFRVKRGKFALREIESISDMGHEIGYHYEDLCTAGGDYDKALRSFQTNLESLRRIAPVKTICMHGSPWSKHDNRDLWKKKDYTQFNIVGEPYFDIDFSEVLYLTDTGRCWDGIGVNIRDHVKRTERSGSDNFKREETMGFHSTHGILRAINNDSFPKKAMMNVHPQRWHDWIFPWIFELVIQNMKNSVKKLRSKS